METLSCDLCGSDSTDRIYAGADWQQPVPDGLALVRCRVCGLMYLNPRPGSDEIEVYYPSDYLPFRPAIEDERSALMRWMRRRKLIRRRKMIEKYSGQRRGRILDVGCATGLFLHEMAQSGWQTVGIELAQSAAQYARTRLGLEVFQGTLEQADYVAESFDVVTFWDVLEHTFSPAASLTRAAHLLRPGGIVAINVPNWHSPDRWIFGPHWIGFDPPRHLYVFTRSTLSALLEKSGFQVLDWVSLMTSYYASIASIERWLTSRSARRARQVSRVLNFPGTRLIFEPVLTVANWFKHGTVISVFARKE